MTEQQLEANRANAQKSTGPRTEEGKQRSRLNATRHGLTGQVSIMTDEERAAHIAFTGPILKRLAPKGPVENQYAQLIAQDHWRLNRIASIEEASSPSAKAALPRATKAPAIPRPIQPSRRPTSFSENRSRCSF